MKIGEIGKIKTRPDPLWKGPLQDGVTSSLLRRFLTCRERFRVHVIDGLEATSSFHAPKDYGTMWHSCEEAVSAETADTSSVSSLWESNLQKQVERLSNLYPFSREEVAHWGDICYALFPRYVNYWKVYGQKVERTPLLQEGIFDVKYLLPSGRTVLLRGKWDAVDLIGPHLEGSIRWPRGVWVQENKTKSTISIQRIAQQLTFDLQTMFYLTTWDLWRAEARRNPEIALHYKKWGVPDAPALGVCYNVVRRPAHKTTESMIAKLELDCRNGRAGEWFSRWKVSVTQDDIESFCKQTLNPVLENLLDWWDQKTSQREQDVPLSYKTPTSWRQPYFYNPLAEGRSSEVDRYLSDGTRSGLRPVTNLFSELSDESD